MKRILTRGLFLAPTLAVTGLAVDAQTVYGVSGAPAPPWVEEITGPPAGPCSYPAGPIVAGFPTNVPPMCPALGSFNFPLGDIASDPVSDLVYVTDGPTVAVFDAAGTFVNSFPAPLVLTGMGMDDLGQLWITDGAQYGAVVPPPPPCVGVAPPWALGPWSVPQGTGFFGGLVTDLTFDSTSSSLLGCDNQGNVVSFLPGPTAAAGPYGSYNVVGTVPFLIPSSLAGIVFDKARPGSGVHYLTDGLAMAYWDPFPVPGGGPASLTFYTTSNSFGFPGAPYCGLAYSGHGIRYGNGGDNGGHPAPSIALNGQFYVGNNNLSILATGSIPGSPAILRYSQNYTCPRLLIRGLPVNIQPPLFKIRPTANVDASGTATLPAAIPPTTPPGLTFYLQWLIVTPDSLQVTEGMEVTTILP